jgi:hypothetical protein
MPCAGGGGAPSNCRTFQLCRWQRHAHAVVAATAPAAAIVHAAPAAPVCYLLHLLLCAAIMPAAAAIVVLPALLNCAKHAAVLQTATADHQK